MGLNRTPVLEPTERRYEREDLRRRHYIDIAKFGRSEPAGDGISSDRSGPKKSCGAGWDFARASLTTIHMAFEIKPDETTDRAVPFLKAAVAYYKSLWVTGTRVMTVNRRCYQTRASRDACRDLRIKRIPTKPYPQNQRQGRELHSGSASEMGFCPSLPDITPRNCRSGCIKPANDIKRHRRAGRRGSDVGEITVGQRLRVAPE